MAAAFSWMALDENEEIVWAGSPRLHVVLWVVVPGVLIPAVMVAMWPTLRSTFVGVLVWGGVSTLAYLFVRNIDYVVSTKYIYSKWGVLGRSVTQIGLRNIQDTTLSQGILGTRANYGTVSFSTAGGEGTTLAFYVVDDPAAVKAAADRQISAAKRGSKLAESYSNDSAVAAFLSELRATRSAAQRIDQRLEQGGNRP